MRLLKKVLFLCALIIMTAFSCDKEPRSIQIDPCSESYVTSASLNNVIGIIRFNSSIQKYFISRYIEGSIDEVYNLYPCELTSDLQVINLNVQFSGDLFTSDDLPKPEVGGQKIFHISLKKISIINQ
jgi:hypothetical protein